MTIDAQKAFSGTVAPEGADILDEVKLTAWMDANVEGFEGPLTQGKFAGGQSNPTYKISAPSGNYVLRRKPYGPLLPSAHAVDREYKVQSGLYKTGFPVARQYGLCTDDSVTGSWFYVMGMVDGHTIWDGAMPGSTPENRRATYEAMIDTLAALHAVDVEAAGLSDFGKPGNYFGRQVDRWTKQYRLAETETMDEMEKLIAFLPATLPEQTRTSVVHGDYRIDNMIYAKDRPEVLAVLDWELSTLGDPLADFTYVAMAWVTENGGRSGVMDLDRAALGIPELDEMVTRYCAATGRDGVPDMNWYFAYNFFRLAGIIQGIKKRVIEGTASSQHAKDMSERVRPLAEKAWDFAKSRRMSLFDMSGQVALITGSSRGIGKATAEAMAEQGAKVVISSRKQDACDATAAEINARFGDGTAIAVAANISSKDDLQNLVNETRAAFGKITALVCNAASNPYYGPGLGISDDQFRKIMDNNILSNHWLITMVAPEMLERGEGSITIISSIGGLKGSPIIGAYGISKAADMQVARNFSVEFGTQGVRVNCIAPGLVRTDMARALWENPENLKRSTAASTLKRIGEPHEIAGAAVFLASKAGAFTTGQTIVCDGGATISGGA